MEMLKAVNLRLVTWGVILSLLLGLLGGGLLGAYWTRPGGWLGGIHGYQSYYPYQGPTYSAGPRQYPAYAPVQNYPAYLPMQNYPSYASVSNYPNFAPSYNYPTNALPYYPTYNRPYNPIYYWR